MKWSWKTFALQLVSASLLGLALAYVLSTVTDAIRGPGHADSTLSALAFGGFFAPLALAALGGWKSWNLKPLLAAGGIVSVFYSGNPALGLLTFVCAGVMYFAARKLRLIVLYYFS